MLRMHARRLHCLAASAITPTSSTKTSPQFFRLTPRSSSSIRDSLAFYQNRFPFCALYSTIPTRQPSAPQPTSSCSHETTSASNAHTHGPSKYASLSTQASSLSLPFWSSRPTWHRASLNTFRCLIGCTAGDFSTMWFLQSCFPALGMGLTMGMASMFLSPSSFNPFWF